MPAEGAKRPRFRPGDPIDEVGPSAPAVPAARAGRDMRAAANLAIPDPLVPLGTLVTNARSIPPPV